VRGEKDEKAEDEEEEEAEDERPWTKEENVEERDRPPVPEREGGVEIAAAANEARWCVLADDDQGG
jgi:hypothetical protein